MVRNRARRVTAAFATSSSPSPIVPLQQDSGEEFKAHFEVRCEANAGPRKVIAERRAVQRVGTEKRWVDAGGGEAAREADRIGDDCVANNKRRIGFDDN